MNCNPLRTFLHEMVKEGNRFFVIDFQHCSSMDSTFLGILVGLALQLRKLESYRKAYTYKFGGKKSWKQYKIWEFIKLQLLAQAILQIQRNLKT